MTISDDDIQQVRARTDILTLVAENVPLEKRGRRWVGRCPFNEETDLSFMVNTDTGYYYCFGCEAKGDAIAFVQFVHHLSHDEAVARLAERAGVTFSDGPQEPS